ncbi:hypothetical protein [Paenibacillus sp. FSL H7-0714]|uniref:hypothetical protein n=1 Tax=Paenibacillus sp. FSL H7-0714 TaxID=2954735 RepID=UPI0030F95B5A
MITGFRKFWGKRDFNISKWLWKILELGVLVVGIAVFYRVAQEQAGRISLKEYNEFMQALGAAAEPNEKNGSVLAFLMTYLFAVLGIPTAYIFVWIHRIIKWFAIKDVRIHFERENKLLEQQSKHMVL